jgi:hypothetical protein
MGEKKEGEKRRGVKGEKRGDKAKGRRGEGRKKVTLFEHKFRIVMNPYPTFDI